MRVTRRRFLVTAAACGLPLAASAEAPRPIEWSGPVMGGVGTLRLYHPDARAAQALLRHVSEEVRRLERIFSLYDPASEISRLNREGIAIGPSADLVDLLERAMAMSRLTDGAFDPTVQPLWTLYATHFAGSTADPNGPPRADVEGALSRIGPERLHLGRDRVSLARGSALTLNGIAQGYITDRIVELLREHGVSQALANMGEVRAIGAPPARPWQIGLAAPRNEPAIATALPLKDQAAATSGGYGCQFVPSGRFNHIFDPHSGRCADPARSLTVLAADATTADALSTALALMDERRIRLIADRIPGIAVVIVDDAGVRRFGVS
jgi:thiamine biosynthesis lipoprotein